MSKPSHWEKRDYVALTIIPLEFVLGNLVQTLDSVKARPTVSIFTNLSIFLIGFFVILFLYRDFLRSEWQLYKAKNFWFKIALNLVLVIGVFLLLSIVRGITPTSVLSFNNSDVLSDNSLLLMLIGSIPPFIAPFSEEITFRYLLFFKLPNKFFKGVMFFTSSILFGLIHMNNFHGQWLLTIPYMAIGAYFSLIYLFTKNIWSSLLVHWLFNSINSVFPAIFLIIMKIVGAV